MPVGSNSSATSTVPSPFQPLPASQKQPPGVRTIREVMIENSQLRNALTQEKLRSSGLRSELIRVRALAERNTLPFQN